MDWSNVLKGAISGGLSLAGIPWQQNLQKELMHENEAINIAQWNRENQYNSPKEQMKRLKEAGLNPDLVYGGNVQNTAGSAQVTAGTPQAPGAANAVSQAVHNAQAGMLVDSEINKNESEANRNNAVADVSSADARFKNATFGLGIKRLCAEIGFTEQQTMESVARAQMFDMQTAQLSTYIDHMNAEIRLFNAKTLGQYQLNRKFAFDADIAMKELSHWDQTYQLHVKETISNIGLNEAHAQLFSAQATQIYSTLTSYQLYMMNLAWKTGWEGNYYIAQKNYVQELQNQVKWQVDHMPEIYAEAIYNGAKLLKRNDDGSVYINKQGHPVAKDGAALDYGLERGIQATRILEGTTRSFLNVGLGVGAIKGNINLFSGQGPVAPETPKLRKATAKETDMFNRWVFDAKNKGGDLETEFRRIKAYKQKHGIDD